MQRFLAAVAVLTLTACINDSVGVVGTQATGGDPLSANGVAGSYTLRSVGGAGLPFTMSQAGADKGELLDDVFTLTTTNGWSEVAHERYTISGVVTVVTRNDAGSFTRSSTGEINFTSPDVSPFNGTVGGGTMTLHIRNPAGDLLPAVFTK